MPRALPADVVIRPGRPEDAEPMTELMVQNFDTRLPRLGMKALTVFHRHLITSKYGLCVVAERHGRIIATGAATLSNRKFYREFVLRKGWLCAWLALPNLFKAGNLRLAFTVRNYFTRIPNDDPEAEWLNLIVDSSAQGLGLGNELWSRILVLFRENGVKEFKLPTDVRNERANRMYRERGCRLVRTEALHEDTMSNVYIGSV
jgi:ribosomal protein S18 acetylase RimI-like enzyme